MHFIYIYLTKLTLFRPSRCSYYRYMQPTKKKHTQAVVQLLEMPNGGASDIALKKGVEDLDLALERITALRPVTWYWKSDTSSTNLQHGFIAQEVEDVLPELVSEKTRADGTSYKTLSSKALLPYLIKALKEQQEQIDALKVQIEASKN